MKKALRFVGSAMMAGLIALGMPLSAYASSYTYITSVSIKVKVDIEAGDEINDGDDIDIGEDSSGDGTYVYTTSSKYTIESAQWATDDDEVGVGDTPKIEVYLDPAEDDDNDKEYRFRSSYSSSSVSISGGTFVSATRKGEQLKVVLKVKAIKGYYSEPEDVEWGSSIGRATWDDGDDSSGYFDVYLLKDDKQIKKVEDYKGYSYNFYPYMTEEADYTFKVRTVPHGDDDVGKKSDWVESDSLYIDEDEVSDGTGQDTDGSTTGSSSSSSTSTASGGTLDAGWYQDGNYWYFRYPDGTVLRDSWLKWNDAWYLLDSNGAMLTGWQTKDGYTYYLNSDGKMKTGWLQDNGVWYYLNPNEGGPEGALVMNSWLTIGDKVYFMTETGIMAEGWLQIEGNYYYFYPDVGYRAESTTINGFVLDENGIWQN